MLNGNINIDSVNDIEVLSEYGDVDIENVNEILKIKMEDGNIKINNLNLINNSYIDVEYGNIEIAKTNNINIDAKTNRGELKIERNNKKSNIEFKVNSYRGDIKINKKEGNING